MYETKHHNMKTYRLRSSQHLLFFNSNRIWLGYRFCLEVDKLNQSLASRNSSYSTLYQLRRWRWTEQIITDNEIRLKGKK